MGETASSNRMMIVEDDAATLRALGATFSRKGWEVCTAATVAEALGLLEHSPAPDFLILDLMLPDGDGEVILRRVKEAGLASHVIICTGVCDPIRRNAARDLGPQIVVTKPIAPDILQNLCGNWSRLG